MMIQRLYRSDTIGVFLSLVARRYQTITENHEKGHPPGGLVHST